MDRATQLLLNRINQRFYAAIAHEWPDKRKRPWPGFELVWQRYPAAVGGEPLRVLDVGCGDGRFAQFLRDKHSEPASLRYLGLDNSPALLSLAEQRALGEAYRFQQADVMLTPLPDLDARYQLIVAFGVLHHIPSFSTRAALVRALGQQLSTDGVLVLTIWRLDEDPRFASRKIDLQSYNGAADEPVDLTQLEPGDVLLRWDSQPAPRYCHFPDEAELSRLVAASELQLRERFRADGHLNRMNEYVVLSQRRVPIENRSPYACPCP